MTDFTLEPDDLEAPGPARRPQAPRLVTTGLHPTAAVPTTRTKDLPPAYAPCAACGQPVLTGQTRAGTCLVLDISVQSWCVSWDHGARCRSWKRAGRIRCTGERRRAALMAAAW